MAPSVGRSQEAKERMGAKAPSAGRRRGGGKAEAQRWPDAKRREEARRRGAQKENTDLDIVVPTLPCTTTRIQPTSHDVLCRLLYDFTKRGVVHDAKQRHNYPALDVFTIDIRHG